MAENLVDIVKGIVAQIDLNISVTSTDGVNIILCKTLHITVGSTVGDGLGNEYLVTAMVDNTSIDVSPLGVAPIFAGTIVIAPVVTVLHGSPASTNNEYQDIEQVSRDKTPFIWLLESYEYVQESLDSSIVARYDTRLFFMDLTSEELWINDQHNDLAIKPMENLQVAFKEVIDNDFTFKRLESYRVRVRPRFGVEVTNQGSDEKIINEDLSGVEVNMTIELYDLSICKTNC
jgi:hypothetical protein